MPKTRTMESSPSRESSQNNIQPSSFKTLQRRRTNIIMRLAKMQSVIAIFDTQNQTLGELECRIEALNGVMGEHELIAGQMLEVVSEENVNELMESFTTFEEECITLKSKMKNLAHAYNSHHVQNAKPTVSIKLPVVPLPTFDGCYENWSHFHQTFNNLINENQSLSNIERFHYLLGALQSDAKRCIELIPITHENYTEAWKSLIERYDNKKIIMEKHLASLFRAKAMASESSTELRKLIDEFTTNIAALKALKLPVESWDQIIVFMVTARLDAETRRLWETDNKENLATWFQLKQFLINHWRILDSLTSNKKQIKAYDSKQTKQIRPCGTFVSNNGENQIKSPDPCIICKERHALFKCEQFVKLTVKERQDKVRQHNLCYNCMKIGHSFNKCMNQQRCKVCKGNHHTMLHADFKNIKPGNEPQQQRPVPYFNEQEISHETNPSNTAPRTLCASSQKMVSLSTVIVSIKDCHGNLHDCRAILDSASDSHYITTKLAQMLKLHAKRVLIPVSGLSGNQSIIKQKVVATIESLSKNYKQSLEFLVISNITGLLPTHRINIQNLDIPTNLTLADPDFHVPNKVDMLLGTEIFYELLMEGQIKFKDGPILQKTVFGWIFSGKCHTQINRATTMVAINPTDSTLELKKQMEKFWTLEHYDETIKYLTSEETYCERHFNQTHTRDEFGRFIVQLPIKANIRQLGESYELALKCFLGLERKFSKNPELKAEYSQFIAEYLELSHMEDVTNLAITDQTFESNCNSLIQDAQNISTQSQCHSTGTILTHTNLNPNTANQPKLNTTIYYMPHHAVYKPSSTTTKTRVVFNASAKTNTGISLNDVLCVGPTVQADNFAILLKFRQHQFAIMADIAKMYRQIMIHPTQQNLQRILYRDDVHSPIKHYKLKTVTYGTASASYLATRCINQLAYEHLDQYPEASRVILSSFYVDDLLTGSNNIDHAVKLQTEINTIISSAGMSLRKWVSNEITILKSIPENHRETCNEQTIIKALGICWDPKSDILSFIINPIERIKVNKRNVLSQIAKIYDPIGWIAPVVLKAKIFMKGLWLININWDEDLPSDYADEWLKFRNTFDILNNIKIPRYIIIHNACTIDLHGFSDGSEKAYGAALYIRSVSADGEVSSKLLCAKSRVAPVNQKSLARLELCGALLLSKLSQRVLKSLDVKFDSVTLWSDSTIVLSWIKTTPASLKTFVANRVAQIQEATQHFSWKHIATADNPADSVSRGYMPKEIVNSAMWWHGPTFFSQPVHEWPQTIINIQPADPAYNDEFKSLTTLILQKNDLLNVIEYHSNFTKLRRVIAYVRRFANNLKAKSEKLSQSFINDHLTVAELNAAEQFIIRISQQTTFADEIKLLKAEKNVSSNSPLKFLNPFIDKNDIMRVGGRIQNASNASYDQIHQVILPKHHLSHIIISELHISFGHPAQQALLAIVRQRFWPLSAKTTIRRIIHQCIRCYRAKPLHLDQFMGNLPNKRITPSHPFENCGVDYAGPLNIKLSKTRKPSTTKAYIAIFVCFSTKAIHIELVSDLTTDAFLAALDRFIARRGICRHIHSDNGSNFIGANTELRKFYRKLSEGVSSQSIINYCSKNNIQWHFIPPRAPEFGGLWEAAVKSTKYHLKRIVADAMLTFEELNTVLVKIEAILNSRPLTALSNDPADLEVLTPGHFLVGRPLTSRPEHDVTHLHLNRLDRWQRLSQIQQQFWTRWSREYLHQLQIRTKNYRHHVKFKEGDLVLLMEDNVPPLQWIIGRISQVFLGNDKIIRVVNVRTAKGVFKRAVNKLCLLPVESD